MKEIPQILTVKWKITQTHWYRKTYMQTIYFSIMHVFSEIYSLSLCDIVNEMKMLSRQKQNCLPQTYIFTRFPGVNTMMVTPLFMIIHQLITHQTFFSWLSETHSPNLKWRLGQCGFRLASRPFIHWIQTAHSSLRHIFLPCPQKIILVMLATWILDQLEETYKTDINTPSPPALAWPHITF